MDSEIDTPLRAMLDLCGRAGGHEVTCLVGGRSELSTSTVLQVCYHSNNVLVMFVWVLRLELRKFVGRQSPRWLASRTNVGHHHAFTDNTVQGLCVNVSMPS